MDKQPLVIPNVLPLVIRRRVNSLMSAAALAHEAANERAASEIEDEVRQLIQPRDAE